MSEQTIERPVETAADAPSPAPAAPREPSAAAMAIVNAVAPTFEQMMRKPKRTESTSFLLPQEEGEPIKVQLKLEAIDGPAYDALQEQFPPTAVQRAKGGQFDMEKFGPALLARVVVSPSFTSEQWAQLWNNPRWSGGEIASLFWAANGLCLKGLDVPFTSGA